MSESSCLLSVGVALSTRDSVVRDSVVVVIYGLLHNKGLGLVQRNSFPLQYAQSTQRPLTHPPPPRNLSHQPLLPRRRINYVSCSPAPFIASHALYLPLPLLALVVLMPTHKTPPSKDHPKATTSHRGCHSLPSRSVTPGLWHCCGTVGTLTSSRMATGHGYHPLSTRYRRGRVI